MPYVAGEGAREDGIFPADHQQRMSDSSGKLADTNNAREDAVDCDHQ